MDPPRAPPYLSPLGVDAPGTCIPIFLSSFYFLVANPSLFQSCVTVNDSFYFPVQITVWFLSPDWV